MSKKQIVTFPTLDIDGTPRDFDRVGEAIRKGDLSGAQKILDDNSDTVFRKDLTPEALTADLARGDAERRAGRQPQFALSKLERGQSKSPFDIQQSLKESSFKRKQADRSQAREDRRLSILTNQFTVNAKFREQELFQKTKKLVRQLKREDGPEAKLKIIQSVMKTHGDILRNASGDQAKALEEQLNALSKEEAKLLQQLL